MNAKKFARLSISLTLVLLILVAAAQIAIDPLFQYHTPWFGLKPVITNERYQNAGVAKNFDFDNVIMGNSFCENFRPSSFEAVFDGKTVKVAISGSSPEDWSKLLRIVNEKEELPRRIILNIDPYTLLTPNPDKPSALTSSYYLYDDDIVNDVNYLYNFDALSLAFDSVVKNQNNTVPELDTVFLEYSKGKDSVIEYYKNKRNEYVDDEPEMGEAISLAEWNLDFLIPFISDMQNTEFYVFFTPVSVLYWDKVTRDRNVDCWYAVYNLICKKLIPYQNVKLYLWSDDEMLCMMSDIENYKDEAHYTPEFCEVLVNRIGNYLGIVNKDNYLEAIDNLFDYIKNYDYDSLFE